MKQRLWTKPLFTLLLLLAGGALINIAMAWSCALIFKLQTIDQVSTNYWRINVDQAFGRIRFTSWPLPQSDPFLSGHQQVMLEGFPHWSRVWQESDATSATIAEDACGWPAPCLVAQFEFNGHDTAAGWIRGPDNALFIPQRWSVHEGIIVRQGQKLEDIRALPMRPLWLGMLVNSVTAACMLYLMTFAPRDFRRLLRVKRGQCPKCAYPVGTSSICTECGHAL